MVFSLRVLCLGNDLLADDAFGPLVAKQLRLQLPSFVEVVETSVTGFGLIDVLTKISHLLVIDTIKSGNEAPGTIYVFRESDTQSVSGPSPHYIGLFETLKLATKLLLPVPEEVTILAVEAADCTTIGGSMHPGVQGAVPVVVALVREVALAYERAESAGELAPPLEQAIATVSRRFGRGRFAAL